MRVLHVGKYFPPHPGGIEYVLHDLLPAQAALGIEPAALVHHHERGLATACEAFRGLPVWRVRTFGSLVYAPLAPAFPFVLRKILRQWRPDVIHVHAPNVSAFSVLLPGLFPGDLGRIRLVMHWHSDVVASRIDRRLAWAYRVYRPFERALLRHAARIIATSQPYLESSETLRPYREKCLVMPLGVDPARLPHPQVQSLQWASAQWRTPGLKVLCVGRLSYYKGHRYLLDAVARHGNLSLVLVGGGEGEAALRAQAAKLNLGERLNLLGYMNDEQVRALLAACDVFCLPSIERTEAFGVALLEAMRYDKPLVATAIPGSGVQFVTQNGVNGLLVEPMNVGALADALTRLADDLTLRRKLGDAGGQRFEREFHIQRMARATLETYQSL